MLTDILYSAYSTIVEATQNILTATCIGTHSNGHKDKS